MTPLSICLILVLGPFSITKHEIPQYMQTVNAKLSEVPMQVKVKRIRTKRLPRLAFDNIPSGDLNRQQLTNFWRAFQAIPKTKTCSNVHVVLPPMIDTTGQRYGGGVALRKWGCWGKMFTVANAFLYSKDGSARLESSAMAASHEIVHAMGGFHVDGPLNLMSPGFPPGVRSKQLPIFDETKRQLCL